MKAIYTDLDSLFDTRAVFLGLLTNQGEYSLGKYDYHRRIRDNFGTLSDKIFHYYYKYRTNKVLNVAPPTNVLTIIKDYLVDNSTDLKDGLETILYVNEYPYNLSASEMTLMTAVITKNLPGVTVKFIGVRLQDLKASWVAEKINLFISYTAVEWLNYVLSSKQILDHPLLNVMMLAPFRVEGNLPSKNVNDDLLHQTIAFFRTVCDFSYVDIASFNGRK